MNNSLQSFSAIDFEKLKSECFWDYNHTKKDIIHCAREGNFVDKKHLFTKILFNSNNRIKNIKLLFLKKDLTRLFDTVTFNAYNRFAEKNILIARNFLLNEKHSIKGLEWNKL